MIIPNSINGLRKTLSIILTRHLTTQSVNNARLAEVGKLSNPKNQESYQIGQLFLHRVFGYRGVILYSWRAKVYDRNAYVSTADTINDNVESEPAIKDESDLPTEQIITRSPLDTKRESIDNETQLTSATDSEDDASVTRRVGNKEITISSQVYYQVLIDSRDCPHVRAQNEAVTFLSHKESNGNLYAIPGLDYVAHEDILPYSLSTREKKPLKHELFDKFLIYTGEKDVSFKASGTLYAWVNRNHKWLEVTEVHRETTENIRVTVIPFYMGKRQRPQTPIYWWRYSVRLENLGPYSVQLRERHWRIFALSGTLETVRGRGVVGQEPILKSQSPAFQYSSHVSLQAPSGHMWGTFLMEREDGYSFDCRIPPFSLESISSSEPNR